MVPEQFARSVTSDGSGRVPAPLTGSKPAPRLTIGSWPGREFNHNPFVPLFLDSLEAEGFRTVDVSSVRALDIRALDVLLMQWPEKVFWEAESSREAVGLMARLLRQIVTRPRGTKVVWLVHDLKPYESRWFKRLAYPRFAALLARVVDGAFTLSPGTVPVVKRAFPGLASKPVGHVWHPLYPDAGITPEARGALRERAGWSEDTFVYGYCGQIRPYKGLDELAKVFVEYSNPQARLLITGRPLNADITAKISAIVQGDDRVDFRPDDLTPEAFRNGLNACDLIVAPQRKYLHSGSIIYALSAGRPVLTPSTPFAESLRETLSADWVRTYSGSLTGEILAAQRPPSTPLDLSPLAPEQSAAGVRAFIESLGAGQA